MSDSVILEAEHGTVSLERVGTGPDLIMLHSLLSDRNVFEPILATLATNWRVNLVDLPGFGSTPRVEASIDSYADVVGGLLAAGGYDPETTVILGNGLGAFAALGTAVRHGNRFGRLVLVGCGVAFPDEARSAFRTMIERVEHGGMDAVVDVAVRRIFSEEYLTANPEMLAERADVLRRTDPEAFRDACHALIDLDYRRDVGGIVNPTLIVVGTEDAATPPILARELDSLMADSRLVELEGIAHAPQLQDPEGFLAALTTFL